MLNNGDLISETDENISNFQQFETIRPFAKTIFIGKIFITTLNNADEGQSDLLVEIIDFKKNQKTAKKGKKRDTLRSLYVLFDSREKVLNGFKSRIFPLHQLKTQNVSQI